MSNRVFPAYKSVEIAPIRSNTPTQEVDEESLTYETQPKTTLNTTLKK